MTEHSQSSFQPSSGSFRHQASADPSAYKVSEFLVVRHVHHRNSRRARRTSSRGTQRERLVHPRTAPPRAGEHRCRTRLIGRRKSGICNGNSCSISLRTTPELCSWLPLERQVSEVTRTQDDTVALQAIRQFSNPIATVALSGTQVTLQTPVSCLILPEIQSLPSPMLRDFAAL